jgi:hypothetical protein
VLELEMPIVWIMKDNREVTHLGWNNAVMGVCAGCCCWSGFVDTKCMQAMGFGTYEVYGLCSQWYRSMSWYAVVSIFLPVTSQSLMDVYVPQAAVCLIVLSS